jgi:hypothetical protein
VEENSNISIAKRKEVKTANAGEESEWGLATKKAPTHNSTLKD